MIEIGESTISRILVFHLKVLGIWYPGKFSIFYFIYSVILYVVFSFIYVVCMCISMCMNFLFPTNIRETIHSMYMTLTCVALLCKTTSFLWHNRDMKQNLKTTYDFQLQNDDEISLVRNRLKFYWNIWLSVYLMINATIVAAFISALLTVPRQLPFRAWYPLDWQNDENEYWIAYAYQVVGMVIAANLNIVIEVYPGYLIYMVNVKMEILAMRLCGMGKNLKENFVRHIDSNREEQQKSIDDLVGCIKLHQHIVKFTSQIENNFSIAYFSQFCLSGIVICSVVYAMTTTSFSDGKAEFSFYGFFFIALVTQIFLPCYLGNEVIFNNDIVMKSAYNSTWHFMSLRYRKLLLLLMERLKRKSQILVGKLFPLSLDTFTSIIYFAYRLYAVINNTK